MFLTRAKFSKMVLRVRRQTGQQPAQLAHFLYRRKRPNEWISSKLNIREASSSTHSAEATSGWSSPYLSQPKVHLTYYLLSALFNNAITEHFWKFHCLKYGRVESKRHKQALLVVFQFEMKKIIKNWVLANNTFVLSNLIEIEIE